MLHQAVHDHLATVWRLGQVLKKRIVAPDDATDVRLEHEQGEKDKHAVVGIAVEQGIEGNNAVQVAKGDLWPQPDEFLDGGHTCTLGVRNGGSSLRGTWRASMP